MFDIAVHIADAELALHAAFGFIVAGIVIRSFLGVVVR